MAKFDVKTVNGLLGIDDAFKAPERLMEILLKKEEREELSDRAIPFLLFNAAIRGINAVIIQCDSLDRKAKRAFYVKNDSDNFLAFSDILEVPKTDKFGKFLNVKWGELE